MDIQFIKTQKGKLFLLIGIYRYNLHTKNKKTGSSYWRCVSEDCNISITLDKDNKILREPKPHSCSPYPEDNEVRLIIDKCKTNVCENLMPIEQMFDEHFENYQGTVPI